MVIAYLVAAAIAAAAAYGGADFRKIPYWRRWDPAAIWVALRVVDLLYVLTGVAVTYISIHLGFEPLGHGTWQSWVHGVCYGGIALAVLRVELPGTPFELLAVAKLLLRAFLRGVTPRLDDDAARCVVRKVGDLRPRPLCRASWQLYLRHVETFVDPTVASEHAGWLRAHHPIALDVDSGDPSRETDAIEAQERLRFYCERLIIVHEDATIEFEA